MGLSFGHHLPIKKLKGWLKAGGQEENLIGQHWFEFKKRRKRMPGSEINFTIRVLSADVPQLK
ncbi:MAG: hypothetical protein AMJ91_02885 [candidate division Zixibacteria bacterium SM23_73_3]|nr:MAG: hypothetical protein AMJ91_02885 [candidate division Zixibacteria bacterium SM23_73_3]